MQKLIGGYRNVFIEPYTVSSIHTKKDTLKQVHHLDSGGLK